MIIVLGSITVRDGSVDEALALSQAHVDRSRLEPGCISHAVHRDAENPHRLVFVERWADMAALQQHFQVPASRAFVKSLAGLVVEPPQMAIYDAAQVRVPG
jgi:quinol monooxygenase YgiN